MVPPNDANSTGDHHGLVEPARADRAGRRARELQRAKETAEGRAAELVAEAGGETEEQTDLDLILWDLAQASVLNDSAKLAVAVQTRLNALLEIRDRGVKQAPFVVLTGATMPAILVEVGFLSNPSESTRLGSAEHQQALARAIATGIDAYLRAQ